MLINLIFESRHKPNMRIYLKILALFYLYGATVHCANLLGFGEIPFRESPLSWQVGDISYGILGSLTFVGLWLKTLWGIICFCLSAVPHLILYIVFPKSFAFNAYQKQLLLSMIIFHLVTLSIFFGLLLFSKRNEQYNS